MQSIPISLQQLLYDLPPKVLNLLFSVIVALIVFFIGYKLTRWAERYSEVVVKRAQPNDNDLLVRAIRRIVFIGGLGGTAIVALGMLGVNVSALIAGLGLTSAALAFALKDTIEQAITGVVLLFQRPFKVGDIIEVEGVEGVVEDISIRTTNIKTFDGLQVLVPNNRVYQGIIRNKSHYASRRGMLTMGIAYENDLTAAHATILQAVSNTPGVLADPAPNVSFEAFEINGLRAAIRYWFEPATTDGLKLQTTIMESVMIATSGQGIRIPQPAQAVMLRMPDAHGTTPATSPAQPPAVRPAG
jgi:small-conductance mechanosensitive channel